jgi:hypothetical protein
MTTPYKLLAGRMAGNKKLQMLVEFVSIARRV